MRKDRYIRTLLLFFVAVAVLLLAVVVGRHSKGKEISEAPGSILPKGVDLALKQIHFSETDAGVAKWELFAASAVYDKGSDLTRFEKIRFLLPAASKAGSLTVTADQGEYRHNVKNIFLNGNVRADGANGFHFEADRLEYLSRQSMLKSSSEVYAVNGPLSVRGIGFEMHTESRQMKILRQVDATIVQKKISNSPNVE